MTIKKQKNQGFTLAELLISIVITLLILILTINTFILNQRTFRKSTQQAELVQNARVAMDVIARDLRQANEIVTVLPPNNSNPELLIHELQFEDGHENNQIQYIRYYSINQTLKRQIIIYYFESEPEVYVHWNDLDAFGKPEQTIIEEKDIAGEILSLNLYGDGVINIEMTLRILSKTITINSAINPRNT